MGHPLFRICLVVALGLAAEVRAQGVPANFTGSVYAEVPYATSIPDDDPPPVVWNVPLDAGTLDLRLAACDTAILLDLPTREFGIRGLDASGVSDVRVLGLPEPVDWRVDDGTLKIVLPERMPVSPAHVIAIGAGARVAQPR